MTDRNGHVQSMPVRVSVVVPTRNRAGSAVRTVQSILANRHPSFELIVVDQSETDSPASALASAVRDARCRYIRSHTRGISAARNTGVGLAIGSIVVHTDDDCEVAAGWLESVEETFRRQPDADLLFGHVLAGPQKPGGFIPAYFPPHPVVVRGVGQKHRIEGIGACFAYRRRVWEELGGFDEMLGIGGAFHSAEDSDFAARALAQGFAVGETRDFAVTHHGFRTWKEGGPLIEGYLHGLGAMTSKHLRLRPLSYLPVIVALAARWAFRKPVVDLGHFPSRWLRLRAFARGFAAGFRQSVSPNGRFVEADGGKRATLCVLPWIHLFVPLDGKVRPCCIASGGPPTGDLRQMSVREAWNSPAMRTLRLDMLAGRRNALCDRCYRLEDAGVSSLRGVYNRDFVHLRDVVSQTQSDGSADPGNVAYLDIRFSNLCNLKCRSCGSMASTAWYRDDPATAPKDLRVIQPTDSPESFWQQIEPFLPSVERIHFAGGEPLLIDEHYWTLERLLKLGRRDVFLSYNTNLSRLEAHGRDVLDLWSEFSSVRVMASFDGSGKRGEYIRGGLDWDTAVRNWRLIRERCPHARLQVNFTLSLLNLLHLADFHAECVKLGMIRSHEMFINLVLDPEYLSVTTLPEDFKKEAAIALRARMRDLEGDPGGQEMNARFREVLEFLKSPGTTHRLPEFRKRTLELDQSRNENFSQTFPELASLMTTADNPTPAMR